MRLKIATLALLASCAAASAADVLGPAPEPVYRAAVYNWTGFYIGAMGGYGWSNQSRLTIDALTVTDSSNDLRGGFGGGTIGYNWQPSSNFVVGVEADAAWSDIKISQTDFGVTATDKIQSFGSVTGRVGVTANAALIYLKGGYAWADNEISASGFRITLAESRVHSGWTIGGGLEYLFVPNWSAKVEYMYADYGNAAYLTQFVRGGIGLGATVNTIKGGVDYHFGGPAVPAY
jgi:outer membrane immunogenic protein